jgi:hypothetical protein
MASTPTEALRELLTAARRALGESSDARVVGERVKVRTVELLDGRRESRFRPRIYLAS